MHALIPCAALCGTTSGITCEADAKWCDSTRRSSRVESSRVESSGDSLCHAKGGSQAGSEVGSQTGNISGGSVKYVPLSVTSRASGREASRGAAIQVASSRVPSSRAATAPQKPGAAAKQSAKVAPKRVVSDEQESSGSASLSAGGDKSSQRKSRRVATQAASRQAVLGKSSSDSP